MPEAHPNEENSADKLSLEQLLAQLQQPNWMVNWRTADALAQIGDAAVPQLIESLANKNGYVRNGAAIALGKIGNKRAMQPLLQALQWSDDRVYEDDEDKEARTSAASALGTFRDHALCEPLLKELEKSLNTDSNLASYIIDALGEIGNSSAIPALCRLLGHRDSDVQKSVAWAIAKMGDEGIEILLRAVSDHGKSGRQYAVRALGASKAQAGASQLISILRDCNDDEIVRCEAARALGKIGSSGNSGTIFACLKEMLSDARGNIRISALKGMGLLKSKDAYEPVMEALQNPELEGVAVTALGDLGDSRACNLLIPYLGNADHGLRHHAIVAIGKLGCIKAVPELLKLKERADGSPFSMAEQATVDEALKKCQP